MRGFAEGASSQRPLLAKRRRPKVREREARVLPGTPVVSRQIVGSDREIAIDCELGAGDGKQMVIDRQRIGIDYWQIGSYVSSTAIYER
jgi:hypothetical protein